MPDASRTAKGLPIVNLINMQPDETVTTLMKVQDFALGAVSLLHDAPGPGQADRARSVPVRALIRV